jgi:hypothetical protein
MCFVRYSPELAPADYHLFGPLKQHLDGKRFRNNEEVVQDIQEWLHSQPKDFFLSGIRKLPGRWRRCIANQGDCGKVTIMWKSKLCGKVTIMWKSNNCVEK